MDQLDINEMAREIEEDYFKGKDLRKLIQKGRDRITISNYNNCLLNLKG